MQELVQQLIIGLSIGATYALIALGYTMVYGVLRLINFAHGEVYMAGAVVGFYLASALVPSPMPPAVRWWIVIPLLALTMVMLLAGLGALAGRAICRLTAQKSRWVIRAAAIVIIGIVGFAPMVPKPLGRFGPHSGGMGGPMSPLAAFTEIASDRLGEAYSGQQNIPAWVTIPAVFIVSAVFCAVLGFCIELFAYRPLRTRARLVVLITAIGVSLLLQNLAQLQSVFGPTPRTFPPLIQQQTILSFHIGNSRDPIIISNLDVLSMGLSLMLMAALWWMVLKTRVGLALRAVSHRVDTAALMGVNTDRTISYTFMFGSILAAVAGVMDGIRYDVRPLMGLMPGLKAFIAAVLGGIGSIPGALVGALLLGVIETLAKSQLPKNYTEYADGVAFVALILILLFKPSGLLGRATREKV